MTTLDADFNALDEHGRIWLPLAGREVQVGQRVLLTDGDVEVEATLAYDEARHVWLGEPEPQTLRRRPSPSGYPLPSR